MKLVIIESPYAGEVEANVVYARRALRDCLEHGEAPIASHLLYTQPGVLNDAMPEERRLGIAAGLEWRRVAELQVFYTDRGWSNGMLAALWQCVKESRQLELRALDGPIRMPSCLETDLEMMLRLNSVEPRHHPGRKSIKPEHQHEEVNWGDQRGEEAW